MAYVGPGFVVSFVTNFETLIRAVRGGGGGGGQNYESRAKMLNLTFHFEVFL